MAAGPVVAAVGRPIGGFELFMAKWGGRGIPGTNKTVVAEGLLAADAGKTTNGLIFGAESGAELRRGRPCRRVGEADIALGPGRVQSAIGHRLASNVDAGLADTALL
eukprot:gnl/Ergobibamus_cyprinoides/1916.p2 GENE.gnl/Ergobibamus_cyprinoides/1916~~gnl/Ergobibamus_cyprinoides/1916.p2  ORF type:complete len:107 (-),score=3.57 gnl/Ergobibamus_cyprinoides/1916:380-700(-)